MLMLFAAFEIADAHPADSLKNGQDTSFFHAKYLSDITLVGRNTRTDIHFLPEIVGTNINAGKKNSLIVMDHVQGN